jgi:hypothetical protein
MEQLRIGQLALPEPPPEPNEFIFGLSESIEGDDLLLVGEGQVVGDEIVEVQRDILLGRIIRSVHLLQLQEIIAELLNDDIAVGAAAGQSAVFLTEVGVDEL